MPFLPDHPWSSGKNPCPKMELIQPLLQELSVFRLQTQRLDCLAVLFKTLAGHGGWARLVHLRCWISGLFVLSAGFWGWYMTITTCNKPWGFALKNRDHRVRRPHFGNRKLHSNSEKRYPKQHLRHRTNTDCHIVHTYMHAGTNYMILHYIMWHTYVYIYIYIDTDRDKERERGRGRDM